MLLLSLFTTHPGSIGKGSSALHIPWEKRPREHSVSESIALRFEEESERGFTLGGMSVESARRVTKLMMTVVAGSPTKIELFDLRK